MCVCGCEGASRKRLTLVDEERELFEGRKASYPTFGSVSVGDGTVGVVMSSEGGSAGGT